MAEVKRCLEKAITKIMEVRNYQRLKTDLKTVADEAIDEINKVFALLPNINVTLLDKETETEDNLYSQQPKYSEAVKAKAIPTASRPKYRYLLKSKPNVQVNVESEFKKAINPKVLDVGITKITPLRNGSLVLQVEEKEDGNKIELEIKNHSSVQLEKIKMKNPKVIIKNIEEELREDNLIEELIQRNHWIPFNKENMKLAIIMKNKKSNARHAILETSPMNRKLLLENRIRLGYQIPVIEAYYSIRRCFRCNKFHHKHTVCESEVVCPLCSGSHEMRECRATTTKCSNCTNYNRHTKRNQQRPTNHTAMDRMCPTYLQEIRKLIANTNTDLTDSEYSI